MARLKIIEVSDDMRRRRYRPVRRPAPPPTLKVSLFEAVFEKQCQRAEKARPN